MHAPSLVQKTAGATFTGLKDITAGDGFTCVLDTTGAAWCWGSQLDGRLGDGTVTSTDRLFPVAVTNGGPGRGAIAAGVDHTCVSQSGAGATGALCWGFNSNYAVGQSGGGDVPTATAVTGGAFLNGAALTPVAAGNSISCGITTSSTLSCWGSNSFGRLGRNVDQATLPSTETPAPVCRQGPCASADLLTGVKSVAIGEQHACAVASGNVAGSKVVRCWGTEVAGRGTLGDDNGAHVTLTAASEPSLPTSADQVAAGAYHTCALLVDRTVRCWGTNNSGKLGNGLNANTPVPALVKF